MNGKLPATRVHCPATITAKSLDPRVFQAGLNPFGRHAQVAHFGQE